MWLWFDVLSVPQINMKTQRRAVASLCYYCQLATRFLPLVRDADEWRALHPDEDPQTNTLPSGELGACKCKRSSRTDVRCASDAVSCHSQMRTEDGAVLKSSPRCVRRGPSAVAGDEGP